MRTEPFAYFADGLRLDADLHLPDEESDAAYPVVVVASGYQGLKVIHPERFARALTPLGYAVVAFDYRGFGQSEGQRGRLVPQDWAMDVRAAVNRITGEPFLDSERIFLIGWGFGGGVVVSEAASDNRVGAVVCANGIADGYTALRHMHDQQSWDSLLERVVDDRTFRSRIGRSQITSPWDIVRLDLDTETDSYVSDELYRAPGFGMGVTLESADYLLRFCPAAAVHWIAPRPLLIVHGEENELHPLSEAQALAAAAGEHSELVVLPGRGHTEWMYDEHQEFQALVARIDRFFRAAPPVTHGGPVSQVGTPV